MNEIKAKSEQFVLTTKVFYFYTPDGFGISKLAAKAERLLGVDTTARNWRTVGKLLESRQRLIRLTACFRTVTLGLQLLRRDARMARRRMRWSGPSYEAIVRLHS